jgi:AcrR family transcriptional regulator
MSLAAAERDVDLKIADIMNHPEADKGAPPDPTESRPSAGRPRDPAVERAILHATQQLLSEVGYDRVTIDGIAARSRASRTTIYRRWDTKFEIVKDALLALRPIHERPDTGSLRDDLIAYYDPSHTIYGSKGTGIFTGLLGHIPRDRALGEFIDQHFVEPAAQIMREIFGRAVERGEIPASTDVEMLIVIVPSFIWRRRIFGLGQKIDVQFITEVVDKVVMPLVRAEPVLD